MVVVLMSIEYRAVPIHWFHADCVYFEWPQEKCKNLLKQINKQRKKRKSKTIVWRKTCWENECVFSYVSFIFINIIAFCYQFSWKCVYTKWLMLCVHWKLLSHHRIYGIPHAFLYIQVKLKPLEKSDLSINFNFIIISWMRHVCAQTQTHKYSSICTCTIGIEWNGMQEPINNCTKTI